MPRLPIPCFCQSCEGAKAMNHSPQRRHSTLGTARLGGSSPSRRLSFSRIGAVLVVHRVVRSSVARNAVDGAFTIKAARAGVGPRCLQPAVAHELGDQDQVVTSADQGGAEGVAKNVAGELLSEARLAGQRIQDVASAAGGQAAAAVVEEER